MKKPQPPYNYDRALVPEHMTKQTIETLPIDEAYYVKPGERDDYEAPTIFVTPDRRLVMSRSHAIDFDDSHPPSPLELVGVMHVVDLDPKTLQIREAYLADLRFLVDNALVDLDPNAPDVEDQEEYMHMVGLMNDVVTFDAFIAPEPNTDILDDGVVPGTFYGDPLLYPYLERLRKKGNKRMKRFMDREAKPDTMTTAAQDQAKKAKKDKKAKKAAEAEKPKQQSGDVSVLFSHQTPRSS